MRKVLLYLLTVFLGMLTPSCRTSTPSPEVAVETSTSPVTPKTPREVADEKTQDKTAIHTGGHTDRVAVVRGGDDELGPDQAALPKDAVDEMTTPPREDADKYYAELEARVHAELARRAADSTETEKNSIDSELQTMGKRERLSPDAQRSGKTFQFPPRELLPDPGNPNAPHPLLKSINGKPVAPTNREREPGTRRSLGLYELQN